MIQARLPGVKTSLRLREAGGVFSVEAAGAMKNAGSRSALVRLSKEVLPMVTNPRTGTNVHEIAQGIYRISTPIDFPNGQGFSFNQYLVVDDEPLLFHTGPRQLFPAVSEAIGAVMPIERLRYVGLSHTEADECGAMNPLLAAAPAAVPLCSTIAAMVSITDLADRPPRALADGEQLALGRHTVQWFDTPHVPHGWDCGLLMDTATGTFFCGDLFTQPGHGEQPVTEADILGPSEAFRQPMDYYAHAPHTAATLARLAEQKPTTLACMHGSAWRGDGAALLRQLAEAIAIPR
jgi:flavorubredoxin